MENSYSEQVYHKAHREWLIIYTHTEEEIIYLFKNEAAILDKSKKCGNNLNAENNHYLWFLHPKQSKSARYA